MAVLVLDGVGKTIDGRTILHELSWRVETDQHWVIIGPNGGGKSTLVRIAALQLHPTMGRVEVLGTELGKADIRELRSRVGLSSAGLVDQLRGGLTAEEIVRCGLHAALETWWHRWTESDTVRALELLADVGLAGFGDHSFASLSSGERQRTLLARVLMPSPSVIVLDEPTAGLDFLGRETLLLTMDGLAARGGPASVLVTHHVEDIPTSSTHLLAIAGGRAVACGPIDDVLDETLMSSLYEMRVSLERQGARWSARAEA